MKICLVGDFSGTPDEGMKNISKTLREFLSIDNETISVSLRELLQSAVINRIREFSPEIIHYVHGPTIKSLAVLKLTRRRLGNNVKTVVSATRPYFASQVHWMIPFVKPELILSQSEVFEQFFKAKGCRTRFIPNGVDCRKFSEVTEDVKQKLRLKLGLPLDSKIVLHVGHIKTNRRLEIFKEIQKVEGVQVVIVGGTDQVSEEVLKADLMQAGVTVIHEYLEDISIVYKAADLYVFPIEDNGNEMPSSYNQVGAIDLPLSIFEAMACNLPVVTTRFGALHRLFSSGSSFIFVGGIEEIMSVVKGFDYSIVSDTRNMVIKYNWPEIVRAIEREYRELLAA